MPQLPYICDYICDADALINLHRHFKRQALIELRRLAKENKLKLPEGVIREIMRGSDSLKNFVETCRDYIEVMIRDNLQQAVSEMERKYGEKIRFGEGEYPGFWTSKAGKQAADGQVVAVAKWLGGICVSDDRAVRLACALENVICIGWIEFARRLGLAKQGSLF